jgi:hypothetical protein
MAALSKEDVIDELADRRVPAPGLHGNPERLRVREKPAPPLVPLLGAVSEQLFDRHV